MIDAVLREILSAALVAADSRAAVQRALQTEGDRILVEGRTVHRSPAGRVAVLAVGKAAAAMAAGADDVLGDRISEGLVVTRRGYDLPLRRFDTVIGGHPTPDAGSLTAARRAAELVAPLREGDLLLVLVSGGASALLADAAPGIALEDLICLNDALVRSGAGIGEINAVRKHISTLKGGGLARLAEPATVVALILSDVVGDDPSTIASGPTVPDPTTLAEAAAIPRRYGITVPPGVARYLERATETLKPGDPVFERVTTVVVGGGRRSCQAAADRAAALGYTPLILSTLITNPAREVARLYAAVVREILEAGHPLPAPCALISGGEATVAVMGAGTGGPNQEFALALALELEGVEGWAALAADTDGIDGPTDAAGGIVGGATAASIRARGLDPAAALAANDAYTALRAGGALLITGPTGTNVNDLRVALIG